MRALYLLLPASIVIASAAHAGVTDTPFGEPVVITQHEMRVDGKSLDYTAEAGRVAIRNVESGEPRGFMFYTAYRVDGGREPRPITFVWNGGPGANSVLLHFEAAGPKRIENAELVDNEDTWLTATDLVFVDPIGTGFSRPTRTEFGDEFYGTVGDVASVTEFVRAWRLLHSVEDLPVLLAGESWGAGRAGSVGYQLLQRGIPVAGLVLISGGTGINRDIGSPELRVALRVVDRTATARFFERVPEDAGFAEAAETWARDVYAPALSQVDRLSDEQKDNLIVSLARYTGMPRELIDRDSLVIAPRAYREGLLKSSGRVLDTFDMRLLRDASSDSTASDSETRRERILTYLRHDLGYQTDLPYLGTEPIESGYAVDGRYPVSVGARWNYATAEVTAEEMEAAIQAAIKHGGGPPRIGPPLPSVAEAVELNPRLRVLVAAGLYDSLNSCAANAEIAGDLESDLKQAYSFVCYEGGHMMYRDELARRQLARDVRNLAIEAN